jgi:hypothetical protein
VNAGGGLGEAQPVDTGARTATEDVLHHIRHQKGDARVESGPGLGLMTVKDAAIASHDFLQKFVEDNPHTATAIALGIGMRGQKAGGANKKGRQ